MDEPASNTDQATSTDGVAQTPVDISKLVSEAVQAQAQAITAGVKDSLFAELRRSGVLGKGKKESAPEQANGSQPTVNRASSERALLRAMNRYDLSDAAAARVEKAYDAEGPEDPGAWLSTYMADLGIKARGEQKEMANPAPTAKSHDDKAPVTGDSPGGSVKYTDDTPLWKLSHEDRAALIKQKGGQWYREKLRAQASGLKVTVR